MENAFPQCIEQSLSAHGLPAERLEIEITESTLISDPERTLMVIHRINNMGYALPSMTLAPAIPLWLI